MKKYCLLWLVACVSCSRQGKGDSAAAAAEIISTDRAMSAYAGREGFHKALLRYADDSVVKLNEGRMPVIGKNALAAAWAKETDFRTISWKPFKAEASRSGDMGYTLGNWEIRTKDSIYRGNYYTFWKRQQDGSWKFVTDGGNNTVAIPAETALP